MRPSLPRWRPSGPAAHGPDTSHRRGARRCRFRPGTAGVRLGGGRAERRRRAMLAFGGHAARARRDLLLPALHAVQSRFGWISPGALDYVCARLTIPPAEAHGVVTFYHLFSLQPVLRPPSPTSATTSPAGSRGRSRSASRWSSRFGAEGGSPGSNGAGITWKRSPCLGHCERGPAALVLNAGDDPGRVVLAPFGPDQVRLGPRARRRRARTPARSSRRPPATAPTLRLLRRIGRVDPESLDAYRAAGGYADAAPGDRARPAGVIREVLASKLMGRGGAAFPTGRKWDAVAKPGPAALRGLQCRRVGARHLQGPRPDGGRSVRRAGGDDDRRLRDRERAGISTCAGSIPLAEARLRRAVEQARAGGLLGENVMNAGFAFDVELRRGAAPISAARRRPCSTRSRASAASRGTSRRSRCSPGCSASRRSINNVETLVNIPLILRIGRRGLCRHRDDGLDRARALLRLRAASSARASTRSISASRSGS